MILIRLKRLICRIRGHKYLFRYKALKYGKDKIQYKNVFKCKTCCKVKYKNVKNN